MPNPDQPSPRHTPTALSIRETASAFIRQLEMAAPVPPPLAPDSPCLTAIDQLCEWAFFPEPLLAKAATSALFGGIIETLCDDFSDHGVYAANLVLTRILQFIRRRPEGAGLHRLLNEFGFSDAAALLARYHVISQPTPLGVEATRAVKKILILSRVTAGADIAITNVIIHRLRQRFDQAELVLIGPAHLPEIFAAIPHCRHRGFLYKNDGSLFEKMSSWPHLLTITQEEQQGYAPEEILLFDPDTRLSQLGLLPLAPDNRTCLFPSRASRPFGETGMNLSQLTNRWLNQLFGEDQIWRPNLVFQQRGEGYHTFCQALHHLGCRLVVVINFGVGNDPRKKVHGRFEADLILALLAQPQTVVILDTGRGQNEGQRLADHLGRVKSHNFPVSCLTAEHGTIHGQTPPFAHGLIIFKGSLGALGKMIDAADGFIGYDSCGQHLAAATRTPSVIVFAGAPSRRFIERWSPGVENNRTIPFDNFMSTPGAIRRLLDEIKQAVQAMPAKGQGLTPPSLPTTPPSHS